MLGWLHRVGSTPDSFPFLLRYLWELSLILMRLDLQASTYILVREEGKAEKKAGDEGRQSRCAAEKTPARSFLQTSPSSCPPRLHAWRIHQQRLLCCHAHSPLTGLYQASLSPL